MIEGSCHCGACRWTLEGDPGTATACNCTLCRRIGGLWAYDYEGERITVSGPTAAYARTDMGEPALEMRFCPTCAAVVCWRGLRLDDKGRRRMAVNLRMADPAAVADVPVKHLDGLTTWTLVAREAGCVGEMWF
jgi:hypothetical protein